MKQQSLAQASSDLHMYPQILINVKVSGKAAALLERAEVMKSLAEAEQALHGKGRVLLRPSGTEPLLRVMVEGEDAQQVDEEVEQLAAVVAAQI